MCSVLIVMAQVDMAPTWLALAGLSKPSHMDGKSITPLIVDPAAAGVPSQTKAAIAALAPKGKATYFNPGQTSRRHLRWKGARHGFAKETRVRRHMQNGG